MRKDHSVGSFQFQSNDFCCVLVSGPDLGGIFSKYSSNAGRNASDELSTSDNDSDSSAFVKIITASELRLNRREENS